MTWVRKKDTEEAREFWSHVETVAESVRGSEIYANHRVGRSHNLVHDGCDQLHRNGREEDSQTEPRHLKQA